MTLRGDFRQVESIESKEGAHRKDAAAQLEAENCAV